MIIAILAVLIIQAPDSRITVTEGLSDHACEEARCVALYGEPCAEHHVTEQRQGATSLGWAIISAREDAAWVAAHPKAVLACKLKYPQAQSFFSPAPMKVRVVRDLCDREFSVMHPGFDIVAASATAPPSQAWCAK